MISDLFDYEGPAGYGKGISRGQCQHDDRRQQTVAPFKARAVQSGAELDPLAPFAKARPDSA